MHIQLLRADVSSLKLDAIVVAADAEAKPQQESRAFVTAGGNLLARFVIHVDVLPGEHEEEQLRATVLAAFDRAEELAIGSIGLPALETAGGLPIERVAQVMVRAALDHGHRARSLQRAVFCLFGQKQYEVFARAMKEEGA